MITCFGSLFTRPKCMFDRKTLILSISGFVFFLLDKFFANVGSKSDSTEPGENEDTILALN